MIAHDVRSFHPNQVLAALFLANDVYGVLQVRVRVRFGLANPNPNPKKAARRHPNPNHGMLQGPQSSKIAHSAHLGGALFGAVWVGLRLFLR